MFVGGQDANQSGRHPHQGDSENQCLATSDAVSNVAKDNGTDGPDHKGEGDGEEGCQRSTKSTERVKKQGADEERGEVGVDVEVVRLERCPHERGPSGPPGHSRIGVNHSASPISY